MSTLVRNEKFSVCYIVFRFLLADMWFAVTKSGFSTVTQYNLQAEDTSVVLDCISSMKTETICSVGKWENDE